jgi:hypothetical protein
MSNVRPQMHRSRPLVDKAFQALSWLLGALWAFLLVGISASTFTADQNFGNAPGFMWLMFTLAGANALASAVGMAYVLFTWRDGELKGIWLLSFLLGLLLMCNVALLPLFRHYVLRRLSAARSLPDPAAPSP